MKTETGRLLLQIGMMAGMTYLIRVIPMAAFRKRIHQIWIRSFLAYVPYGVLSAMTFPAILEATGSRATAGAGCLAAVLLAFFDRGLLTVALGASAAVLIAQWII